MDSLLAFFQDPKVREGLVLLTTQLISFFGFAWVLKKFVWPKIQEALDERKASIEAAVKKNEAIQAELEGIRQNYERRIKELEDESRAKLQAEIAHGKEMANQIIDNAHKQERALIEKGHAHVEIELAKAKATLREEMVSLVMLVSEKILRETVNADAQTKLVKQFIDDLGRKQ